MEFGFRRNEIQHIVTVVPKVLTANKRKLAQVFNFVHNTMGVPHSHITKFPQVSNVCVTYTKMLLTSSLTEMYLRS